jgi:hypothetical protein
MLGLAYLMPDCWTEVSLHPEVPATDQLDQGKAQKQLYESITEPNSRQKGAAFQETRNCQRENNTLVIGSRGKTTHPTPRQRGIPTLTNP